MIPTPEPEALFEDKEGGNDNGDDAPSSACSSCPAKTEMEEMAAGEGVASEGYVELAWCVDVNAAI